METIIFPITVLAALAVGFVAGWFAGRERLALETERAYVESSPEREALLAVMRDAEDEERKWMS